MASQGIQLPISLQISNLQEIANQMKQFAGKNILSDSLGGKKIEGELNNIIKALGQIETRAKNAFKTPGDFSALEKEVNKIELSLDHVQSTFQNLDFKDLKLPQGVSAEMEALNASINALKNNFGAFKAAQKDKLLGNVDFTGNLSKAFGKDAANIMSKNYDEMYKAIENGMNRINTLLIAAKAEFQMNSQLITQNGPNKANFSAWGALDYISKAFEKLPKDASKRSEQQKMIADYMAEPDPTTGQFEKFKSGGHATAFYLEIAKRYDIPPAQMEEIRRRITASVKSADKTAAQALRDLVNNKDRAAEVFAGKGVNWADLVASKDLHDSQQKAVNASQAKIDNLTPQADAAAQAWRQLMDVQKEVSAAQTELDNALKQPTASLAQLQQAVVSSVANMPELQQAFSKGAAEIYNLRAAADAGRQQLAQLDQAVGKLSGIQNFINRYIGVYAIVRKVTSAIRNAFNNIKELDKSITSIAVVTNMSQQDLWGKIGEYTSMAQQYGVATKDVYTVSQIFYQQGLQTSQVMSLTTETLKMAKIAGMDYSTAANAMTVAIRAFNVEMDNAQSVTDTYSALAAKFAVSSAEIANAMEKTASSAANVGMSLQSTSAFISVMEQTTRESAQNIGSALKSIISRYGEMKASPDKLLNVDGEDVAFNKVDTALQSVGISIKDATGQFRNFDDVIMELASKWNTLDNNTQRYIATVMAGNRQQSRFIALVSNYDELSRAMDVANNSQNASIVQTAKTMDSLESKAQQLKNAFSQIYLDLHAEEGLKSMYDWLTKILQTIGKLGVLKGAIPTLMNVVGAGMGAKSLIGYGKDAILAQKGNLEKKINLKDEEARQQAADLQTMLEKEATKKVKIQTDLSELQLQRTAIEAELQSATAERNTLGDKAYQTYQNAGGSRTREEFDKNLNNGVVAKELELNGKATPQEREAFQTQSNAYQSASSQVEALTTSLGKLDSAITSLTQAATNASNATEGEAGAKEKDAAVTEGEAGAKQNNINATEQETTSKTASGQATQTQVSSALQAARANYDNAVATRDKAQAELNAARDVVASAAEAGRAMKGTAVTAAKERLRVAEADRVAAEKALIKAQKDEEAAQAEQEETDANRDSAESEREEANQNRNNNGGGSGGIGKGAGGKGNSRGALMKGIGIVSGVTRLAGTAVTALGASHEDQLGERFLWSSGTNGQGVETSKVLTGLGNGLSGMGTGMSMGMMAGPWGALIGGLVGFVAGGLGAIIDGFTTTISEQLDMAKEKTKKAQDESLKSQAKVTDFGSQLDNLKKLKSSMYDSTESMAAYKEAMNTLAEQYPNLISSYDEAGNAIIDLNAAESQLTELRAESARTARMAFMAEAQEHEIEARGLQDIAGTIHEQVYGNTISYVPGVIGFGKEQALDYLQAYASQKLHGVGGIVTSAKEKSSTMLVQDANNQSVAVIGQKEIQYGNGVWDTEKLKIDYQAAIEEYTHKAFDELTAEELEQAVVDLQANADSVGKYKVDSRGRQSLISAGEWKEYHRQVFESASGAGYEYDVEEVNKKLAEYKNILGEGASVETLTGFQGDKLDIEQLNALEKVINNKIAQNNKKIEAARKQAGVTLAQEELSIQAQDQLSTTQANEITGNNFYSKMLSSMMQNKVEEDGAYKDIYDWWKTNYVDYSRTAEQYSTQLIGWFSTLSNSQKEILQSLDYSQYLSVDEIASKLSIDPARDVEQYKALQTQFIESNKANKDRILKTIYQTDSDGNVTKALNSDLKGLEKYNYIVEHYDSRGHWSEWRNQAQDIADLIGNDEIISKYADYFTTQLVDINELAQTGYTELAKKRLDILHSFAGNIQSFDDSKTQNDLFSIISGINFSDYDSIMTARENIEAYGTKNHVDVSSVLGNLDDAANNLVFNITTLSNNLTTQVLTAAKAIDTLLSNAKSGFSLDKAIEQLNQINARSKDKQFSFDELFQYDAALGKYVFTNDGLMTAMQQEEKTLEDRSNKLASTERTERRLTSRINTTRSSDIFDSTESMMSFIKSQLFYNEHDAEEYETLVNNFMKDSTYETKSWSEFQKYVTEKYGKDSEEAKKAQQQYEAYQANKIHQYYGNIDWGALATGTDLFGTNKNIQSNLIAEINKRREELGQAAIDADSDWEKTINAYLDLTYGTEDEINAITDANERELKRKQKSAAKATALGQVKKSQAEQVSTAINEVLAGEGQLLSATSLVLLDDSSLITNDGVIAAGQDYVNSAMELYKTHSAQLLSVADKNTAYAQILSKQAEQNNKTIEALSSGASLDIDSLSGIFTAFDKELYTFYDGTTRQWRNGLEEVMSTDAFGKTTILNWDKFIQTMGVNPSSEVLSSFEYRNAYSSYVDGLITLDTQTQNLIKSNYENAFSSITGWKPINFSQLASNDTMVRNLTAPNAAGEAAAVVQNGQLVIKDTVQYAKNALGLFAAMSAASDRELMEKTGLTKTDVAKDWKNAQAVITATQDAWAGISENISGLSTDNIATLVEKGGFNLWELNNNVFTKIGDAYVLELQQYEQYILKSFGANSVNDLTPAQRQKFDQAMNSAQGAIINKFTNLDWTKVLSGTATQGEMDVFSAELDKVLASLGMDLSVFLTSDGALNVDRLRRTIKQRATDGLINQDVANQLIKNLDTTVGETRDTMLNELRTNGELLTKGTHNQADMKKFAARYKELTGQDKSINDLFEWDSRTKDYTLKTDALIEYRNALASQLESLGLATEAVNNELLREARELIASEMDVTGFLEGTDISNASKAAQTLMVQIRDYYALAFGRKLTTSQLNEIMTKITSGGQDAVDEVEAIKGTLSSDEIQSIYYAQVNRLKDAAEQLESVVINQVITGDLVGLLGGLEGFEVQSLGDGTAVITAVGDMVAAYNLIYQKMKQSGEATTAELNTQFAKLLNESSKKQTAPVEALANAASMTYDALGEILTSEGLLLENVLADAENYGIQALGAGKVQIKDFTKFAARMGWDTNSDEYTEAFKTYNDALIEMDKKATNNILEEVASLKDAKVGSKINLTYLWTAIQEKLASTSDLHNAGIIGEVRGEEIVNSYQQILEAYGAQFKNGILTIGANADITGLVATIAQMAADNAALLPDELAQLADIVQDYIKSIVDAIKGGISGSLKNTEAQSLQAWATAQGLGKLEFTQTAEGLRLSEQSAIALYSTLKNIDAIQASLVFNELNDSLKETNENYTSVTAIMAHIKDLQDQINNANETTSEARINQYRQELELAQQILAVRSTEEDESFNFMSGKIPGGQNNPINYYNNWATAFAKMQEALNETSVTHVNGQRRTNRGLIDYQDWYNIVTEMGRVAEVSGTAVKFGNVTLENAEQASALIEKGAAALTVDSKGQIKVAMGNIAELGLDMKTGAMDTAKNMDEGIKAIAEAQVEALNGMIAMLELIVSMEQLGDIDVEDNGIDLSDLFKVTWNPDTQSWDHNYHEFSDGYKAWVSWLKDRIGEDAPKYNEDITNAVRGITLGSGENMVSLETILGWTPDQLNNASAEIKEIYPNLLNALYKSFKEGNFDPDHIGQSLMDELRASGFKGTIPLNIGDITYYFSGNTITTVNWQDEDVQQVLNAINEDNTEEAQKQLNDWLIQYGQQTIPSAEALEYILVVKRKATIENGTITSVTVNGKSYRQDDPDFRAAMTAAALEDWGIDTTHWTISDDRTHVQASIMIGQRQFQVRAVVADDPNQAIEPEIVGPDGRIYKSQQEMLDKEWQIFQQQNPYQARMMGRQRWEWQEFRIPVQIKPKFVAKSTGQEVSPSSDPELNKELSEILAGGRSSVEALLNDPSKVTDHGDGTITVSLGDYDFTFTGGDQAAENFMKEAGQVLGIDVALSNTISTGIANAFNNSTTSQSISSAISTGITDAFSTGSFTVPNIIIQPDNISFAPGADAKLQAALDAAAADLKAKVEADPTPLETTIRTLTLDPITVGVYGKYLGTVGLPSVINKPGSGNNNDTPEQFPVATGNFGLAKAAGTLMGELGPELVVSKGRYFVAGQNGPEMVNLADDAIVFNHLQTKSLLEKGMSHGRGQAVTNERNAISFATGNVNGGPALASAASALAALKQLRAQWQALAGLSAQDLANKGGGGGGGGGDPKAFIKELERWYNYLQKIAQLEKQIALYEAKRTTYASSFSRTGKQYYQSQVASLKDLREQLKTQIALNTEQEAYLEKRSKELNQNSAFKSLYTFDEKTGQILYNQDKMYTNKNGEKVGAFEWLSDLSGRDAVTGEANYSAKEQYERLVAAGYGDQMKFDSSGNEIKQEGEDWYNTALQAFWDKMDSEQKEVQDLHDSIEDGKQKSQELQNQQNEILKDIEDNQIAVEQKVLKAVEESRQRAIDDAQEQRDALEKAASNMIDGLSEQLSKEQEMYSTQQEADELAKLQRQLQIMQRSGGSASQIADLQQQIAEKQQNMYFDMQQKQIDALQEASDNELERLDHQIEIMTEQLEYEKENGLLWNEVNEILQGTPEQISDYIKANTSEYWGQSPTQLAQTLRQDLFEIDRFKEQQKDISEGVDLLKLVYSEEAAQVEAEAKKKENEDYIKGLYKELLGRDADEGGLAYWMEQMANGMEQDAVRQGFMNSTEYKNKNGIVDTPTVQANVPVAQTNEPSSRRYTPNNQEYDEITYWTITGSNKKYTNYEEVKRDVRLAKQEGREVRITAHKTKVKRQNYNNDIWSSEINQHLASGGLITEPTRALIGETGRPEAVFNPEQTRILRENILSSRPDSLVSLLKSYKEAYHGLSASTYDSISNNNNNSTIIERAEVNLQVAQLANDYDSRRAANTIMDEMLRIASKTSANNSVRR